MIYSIDQLELILGWPRCPPMKHLVVNQADRPEVRFGCVFSLFEDLRRHVQRCPNNGLHDGFLAFEALGEPKVAKFAGGLLEENVCRLEIPVDNAALVQVLGPVHDVPEVVLGLPLGDPLLLVEQPEEVSVLAEFGDNVHVVGSLIDVEELDDVLVGHFFHDVDLRLDVLDVVGVGEYLLVDDLDRDRLPSLDHPPQVDRRVGPLSQLPPQAELVLLYLLLPLHSPQRIQDIIYSINRLPSYPQASMTPPLRVKAAGSGMRQEVQFSKEMIIKIGARPPSFRFRTAGLGEQFPSRGPGTRFPSRGPGTLFPSRGPGTRFPSRGPGTRFPPRGGSRAPFCRALGESNFFIQNQLV